MTEVEDLREKVRELENQLALTTHELVPLTHRQIAGVLGFFFHAIAFASPKERAHFDTVLVAWTRFLTSGEKPRLPASTAWWIAIFTVAVGGFEGWCGKPEVLAAIELVREDLARPTTAQA